MERGEESARDGAVRFEEREGGGIWSVRLCVEGRVGEKDSCRGRELLGEEEEEENLEGGEGGVGEDGLLLLLGDIGRSVLFKFRSELYDVLDVTTPNSVVFATSNMLFAGEEDREPSGDVESCEEAIPLVALVGENWWALVTALVGELPDCVALMYMLDPCLRSLG